MAYKVFTNGSVLQASEVNENLMNQAVITFTNSTARASAITSPVEGMVTYLADTDTYQFWNGSAWTNLVSSSVGSGNAVINGAFDIWQRGTTGTASGTAVGSGYNTDRWYNYYAGAMTVSRQATGDTTNLPNIGFAARVQRNSGQTSATSIWHAQDIETANSIPFTGKTVTFSFYARRGANYSGASNNLTFLVKSGTGTDQHILAGFTGESDVISTTATLTTTWQRFTATGTVATTATQLGVGFTYDAVGTAGANDWFEVTGVQLEEGSTATPFRRNANSIEGELAACQRYYYQTARLSSNPTMAHGTGSGGSTSMLLINVPVTLRIPPTSVVFSSLSLLDGQTSFALTTVSLRTDLSSPNIVVVDTGGSSGLTAYRPYFLIGGATSFIGFSAEL